MVASWLRKVHRVSGFLASQALNIVESAQYGDQSTNKFFMRVHFAVIEGKSVISNVEDIRTSFRPVANEIGGEWAIYSTDRKPRVCLMVSKIGHCLNDLLFRQSSGQIPITVPLIVSNHPEMATMAKSYDIPFHHIPISKDTKPQAESKLLDLVRDNDIDLVVLCRYMQILSRDFCETAPPIINIHHSFLPSFIGARPYHQAFDRGVKQIGATAHFASSELDEGPIIEQDVMRVSHLMSAQDLTVAGSTIECTVLARAVKWWAERRVMINGGKTVVFK